MGPADGTSPAGPDPLSPTRSRRVEPSPVARIFTLVLLASMPFLAASEEALEEVIEEGGDRRSLYVAAGLSLVFLAAVTLAVAAATGLSGRELGWRTGALVPALSWAVGATAAGLALVWALTGLFRWMGLPEGRAVLFLLPRNRRERNGFLALALVAGVCEEYVFRGFALHVVEAWSGSPALAVVATSVAFGLAHGYQRLSGVLRAGALGGLLAVPVVATGSLFPSVAAHFWINAVIGLGGWRWLASEDDRERGGGADGGDREPGAGPDAPADGRTRSGEADDDRPLEDGET